MRESPPLLKVDTLTKSFGGLNAINQLSFEVGRGSIYSIIGPNGAGKSTLFNCINGLYQPDQGNILFKDQAIQGMPAHQIAALGISRTFQNLELFAHMTTMDNLLLGRHLQMKAPIWKIAALSVPWSSAAKEEIAHRHKVEEIIDFLDLQSVRNQLVSTLPYGRQKMVELGRALAPDPELLLLDEPAAGLNHEEREDLIHWIKDIRNQFNITVVVIEHNMQVVTGISDRILAINFGKKLVEGSVEEVIHHPEVIKAYLG